MISVISTSWIAARIVVVRSMITLRWIDGGIEACSSGSIARTRSTVSMMLAPGWRKRQQDDAGLPFDEAGVADVFDRIGNVGRCRRGAPARRCATLRSAAGIRRP